MGKLKKKLKKKVNPEKSNKMIIAVAVGLLVVFGGIFLLTMGPSKPENKGEAMKEALSYLDNSDGILEVKTIPETNMVVVVYEGYKETLKNYKKIAWYAGIRISNLLPDETVTVKLCKDKEEQIIATYTFEDGKGKVVE